MRRLWVFLLVLLLPAVACKQDQNGPADAPEQEVIADTLPLPRAVAISAGARSEMPDWSEFNALEKRMDAIYQVEGPEDMTLLLDDLLELCGQLEGSEFPETFDQASVRSRIKVFKTFLMKTRGALDYRQDYRPALRQSLEAYNALREQLDRIVTSIIDPSIFKDE